MKINLDIPSRICSLLLALLLLLPAGMQLAHAFEGHDHKACDEVSTHIHQHSLDCDLCDVQLNSFTYPSFDTIESRHLVPALEGISLYIASFTPTAIGVTSLRGPPNAS